MKIKKNKELPPAPGPDQTAHMDDHHLPPPPGPNQLPPPMPSRPPTHIRPPREDMLMHDDMMDEDNDLPPPPKINRPPESIHTPTAGIEGSPPLFIKVNRYKEIVQEVHRLKSFSLGIRDALDALADIESELKNGLSVAQKALDNFNSIISNLDAKFLRIQGIEPDSPDTPVVGEIDDYVQNLYKQMEKIKSDIKTIKAPEED